MIELLRLSARFRTFFNDALANLPFDAFRWETPPLRRNNVNRPFECVVTESRELLRPAEPEVFGGHFGALQAPEVLGIPNLGGDAFLVVPCPGSPLSVYSHLAVFAREAPEAQRDRLWREVGAALDARLAAAPLWLSTAGAGAAWLHIRLDSRPKYYRHGPYRNEPP